LIEASCACGAVQLKISRTPDEVTDCNCTLCRRYGVLWAYLSPKDVHVTKDATDIYMRDPRTIEFHRCKHCGCITHWAAVDKTRDHMGVNARLMAPEILSQLRVRHLDGADTWKYFD
jgi:hypothetical protein